MKTLDPEHDNRMFLASRLGREPTISEREQFGVLMDSFHLFVQRNSVYEDLWKDYGWMDTLTHIRSKAMRLVRKFWRDDPTEDDSLLDDVYDLINYAVFFIRNFRERNKWGRR